MEYENKEGFEPSKKTRNLWGTIFKLGHKHQGFHLPGLYESNNYHWLFLIGFIFIFILECYATFGVVLVQGIQITLIGVLILLDIFFAFLPHLLDGGICQKRNWIFVYQFANESMAKRNLELDEIKTKQAEYLQGKRKTKNALGWTYVIKAILFSLIYFSAAYKIKLFFLNYPFYNDSNAYIVIICYSVGGILHSICTGPVINYYLRFKLALNSDRKKFYDDQQTNASTKHYCIIDSDETINLVNEPGNTYRILQNGQTYKIECDGLLLDEELNDLIQSQGNNNKAEKAVAVAGKRLQLNLLGRESNIPFVGTVVRGTKEKQEASAV